MEIKICEGKCFGVFDNLGNLGDVIDVGGVVVVGDVDEKSLVYAQHNRFIFL